MHWDEEIQVRDAEDNLDIELIEYLINIYQFSSLGEGEAGRGDTEEQELHRGRRKGFLRMDFALLTGAAINPSPVLLHQTLPSAQIPSPSPPRVICSSGDVPFRSLITHEIPFCPVPSHPARAPRNPWPGDKNSTQSSGAS